MTTPSLTPLPIDAILPAIRAATGNLVIEAPPGAGKTTRVPPALLDAVDGEIIVLEPRRLAARLAARRVAEELGEELGVTVGYQVRFEEVVGPRTRIRFVTEGILLRRMLGDPALGGVGAVILDEVHERHLHADLALALLRRLQQTERPALRIVAMSATLDAGSVAAFLGDCPSLRAEGRRFEVAIEHAREPDERKLDAQVASAVRRLAQDNLDGDVLVFLPGAAEIGWARTALAEVAARFDLEVVALHGDLSPAEQDRAIRPAAKRKVILSTNVAESSVTIPGVVAVVDSGLARVPRHSPWTGLPALRVQKISQASATQRAGRAGRTRPGRCVRLYTQHDHDTRPAYETPEIRRADLAETVLALRALGVGALDWLESPEPAALAAAEALLGRLGAVARDRITPIGRRMLRFPLHPRLARVIVEAEDRGVVEAASEFAAIMGEREASRPGRPVSGRSDVLEAIERFQRGGPADRARRQILNLARRGPAKGGPARSGNAPSESARAGAAKGAASGSGRRDTAVAESSENDVMICVLAGFPDRVARRRRPGSNELLLAAGGSAELSPASIVREPQLMVAVDVEERQTGTSRKIIVRMASAIEPEWLIDVAADALVEEREAVWDAAGERVEIAVRLRYDALILDEKRSPPTAEDGERAAIVLGRAARTAGIARFVDAEAWARWRARLAFVARTFPDVGLELPDEDSAIALACQGATSFADLRAAGLVDRLRAALTPKQARLVADMAPERIGLAAGRQVKIEYDGEKPWIASRLQDFFGMTRGPAIAGGRAPLVLHLLAPNQRAVQVTSDLEGFWTRHYPAIRRELSRKYPRHKWPEDPLA